jgi:YD repeat-containing protein
LTRGDARWPALVTRMQHPNGRVLGAVYDGRGNVINATDSSRFEDRFVVQGGCPPCNGSFVRFYAKTRYAWDPAWDFVTTIVPPEKDSSVFAYDPASGNRLWQQDSRGASSRVNFYYYASGPAVGLLRSIQIPTQGPSDPRDSLTYDGVGNLSATKTPLGFWTTYERDAIGRDTFEITPIDSLQTLVVKHRVQYDLMDRDTLNVSIGPQMPGANGHPPDTLVVRTVYGPGGTVDTVTRRASPDRNGLGTVRVFSRYDAAGRKRAEVAADGGVDSTVYDPAGNVIRTITRRGHLLTATYDALNRPIQGVVPSVTVQSVTSSGHGWGTQTFPRYPNDGTSLTIPGDVSTFAYDAVGNVIKADNGDAWIHRTYNMDGSVLYDSLYIRTYVGTDFTAHRYGLTFGYDLDGRRVQVGMPSQLLPPEAPSGSVFAYSYTPYGSLSSVTDVLGNQYRFAYDLNGRVDTLYSPGGLWNHSTYDADSRVSRSQIVVSAFVASDTSFPSNTVRDDRLALDARGKVRSAMMLGRQRYTDYSGLGMVSRDSTNDTRSFGSWWDLDTGQWDAIGNLSTSFQKGSRCVGLNDRYTYQPGTTRQTARAEGLCAFNSAADPTTAGDWDSTDASGNLVRQRRWWGNVFCDPYPTNCFLYYDPAEETFFYYSADQRLRVIDRQRPR